MGGPLVGAKIAVQRIAPTAHRITSPHQANYLTLTRPASMGRPGGGKRSPR